MTSFTVPGKGTRYQWTVTPMGLQGSPASFARLIDYVFRGIKGVITYIDDVLTHSRGHQDQLKVLEQMLLRLRKYNLKLCGGVREFLKFNCVPSASARQEQRLRKQAQNCFLADGLVLSLIHI